MWCWIRTEWRNLRLATFYGPTWFAITSTLVIYIVTGRKILKSRRKLNSFAKSSGRSTVSHQKVHLDVEHNTQLSSRRDSEACLTSSSELEATEDDRACTKQPVPNQNRNKLRESHSAAFAYARCALLFFIAMVVTWVRLNAGNMPDPSYLCLRSFVI